jgi:hypothetical protein
MADKKISQLPNLSSSNYTSSDVLLINNGLAPYTSQTTSKTSVLNFLKYYTGATNTLTGGTYNGSALTITFNGTQQTVVMTGYTDTILTGGTYVITATTGTLRMKTNRGNTFDVTGFTTGFTLTNQVQYNNNSNFSGTTTFFVNPTTSQSWNTGTNLEISNTSYGENAMVNTTGSGNTIYGYQSYGMSGTTGSYNTTFGYNSLYSATTGYENIAFGLYSFSGLTTGAGNIGFGNLIANSNIIGDSNVVLGNMSFTGKTAQTANVVIGYNSYYTDNPNKLTLVPGYGVVIGNNSAKTYYRSNLVTIGNYAIGNTATHTTQSQNNGYDGSVAIGYEALKNFSGVSDTNRLCNLSIGFSSSSTLQGGGIFDYTNWCVLGTYSGLNFPGELNCMGYKSSFLSYGSNQRRLNTFLGAKAGYVTSSNNNTGLGAESCGGSMMQDSSNTAIGYRSITYCQSNYCIGIGNDANNSAIQSQAIAVGSQAMTISKIYCVSIGYETGAAKSSVLTGSYAGYNLGPTTSGGDYAITSIGSYSQYSNTAGYYSTSIGYKSLYSLTTSIHNTALGAFSLYNTSGTTSTGNTACGYNSGYNVTTGYTNTLLGFNSQPSSNTVKNEITLGNSSITTLRCNQTSITSLSDKRDKTNIEPINVGLNFINEINPVIFSWNRRDGSLVGKKSSGFIAQQLKSVEENFKVQEFLKLTNSSNSDKLEASYMNLLPVLIKSLQELSLKNKELKERIKNIIV